MASAAVEASAQGWRRRVAVAISSSACLSAGGLINLSCEACNHCAGLLLGTISVLSQCLSAGRRQSEIGGCMRLISVFSLAGGGVNMEEREKKC